MNLRPLRPERSALAKLSYSPQNITVITIIHKKTTVTTINLTGSALKNG